MIGRNYIDNKDKISLIEEYITKLNTSISMLKSINYNIEEQEFLRDCLNDYRGVLVGYWKNKFL